MDALEHGTEKMGDLIVSVYVWNKGEPLAGREWFGDIDDDVPERHVTLYEGTPEELRTCAKIIEGHMLSGTFAKRVARSIREAVEYL